MSFVKADQIAELCRFAFISDMEIRSDLSRGFIKDEDDYTSNFTGALRRNINSYSRTGLEATSFVLPTTTERTTGCDATIIVQSGDYIKLMLFEAKLPWFSDTTRPWDWRQTSTGLSHFSDQLQRQAQLSPALAVFEMFYCEYPFGKQPSYLQDRVSTCLWHANVIAFDKGRKSAPGVWTHPDLKTMLTAGTNTIADIVQEVCLCNAGEPMYFPSDAVSIAREFNAAPNVLHIRTTSAD